jgi:glutamate dehydrogenase/leucine dehydrogenase
VRKLFIDKDGNKLKADNVLPFSEVNQKIWDVEADIFLPCAASRLVSEEQLQRMIDAGVNVISSGANVPFADSEIFFGPIGEKADTQLSLIPDFIANCGMARVFAYLMQPSAVISDEAIFNDVSEVIQRALMKTNERSKSKTHIAHAAFDIALDQLL